MGEGRGGLWGSSDCGCLVRNGIAQLVRERTKCDNNRELCGVQE